MTKTLCFLALALVAACKGDSKTKSIAPSRSTLTDLTGSLDALRAEFNAHEAEPRFLTLLSAT